MSVSALELSVKRIHRLNNSGATVAYVDVVVNETLLIKGFRIVNGSKGLFVSMPQEKGRDERWYDTVVCLSDSCKTDLSRCVLEAYQNEA